MLQDRFINPRNDLPVDDLKKTKHPKLRWASAIPMSDIESIEAQQLLENTVQYIEKQLLPFKMQHVDVYFVSSDNSLGVYCADGENIPILWKQDESEARNVWFLAHEMTEASIRAHLGPFVPRWLYESLAQLSGWRTCQHVRPGSELEGLKYYEAKKTQELSEEDLLSWTAPRVVLDNPTQEEIEKAIEETKEFAKGEHKSEREGNFYALAHTFSLENIPEDMSVGWALARTIDGASQSYLKTIQSLKLAL